MAFKKGPLESPEEHGEGKRPPRTGKSKEFDGGGFMEGDHGRGSTPYTKKHSAKPGTLEEHGATSGRGGSGIIGGGDDFKGHKSDIDYPSSHAEFEELGTERE
jgi:hypothetical protein